MSCAEARVASAIAMVAAVIIFFMGIFLRSMKSILPHGISLDVGAGWGRF